MQKKQRHFFRNIILTAFFSCLMLSNLQAAGPLWTMVPAAGSNPSQTVPENSTATVQYVVQNQSGKPKRLVIQPIQGIQQTTPCILAPRGQAGSSCTLNLTILGSALPAGGIHGGPALCQARPDGNPNPNQCYQPSAVHILNITKGGAELAALAVSPPALGLVAGSGTSGFLTITNNSTNITAQHVEATLPVSWTDVAQDASNCVTIAPNGGTCQLQFTPGATAHATVTVPVVGSNTTQVTAQLSVSAPAQASLSVTGAPLSLVGGCPTAGVLTVENISTMVAAADIAVNLMNLDGDVAVDNQCPNPLPAGDSCTIELTGDNPASASDISIQGSNTAEVLVNVGVDAPLNIGDNHLGGIVFQIDECNNGKVVTGPLNAPDELVSRWSFVNNDVNTFTSENSGPNNTDNIIAQGSDACGNADDCAAFRCRHLDGPTPDWYLPARDELVSVEQTLCPDGMPCTYGEFSSMFYLSSSQYDITGGWSVEFPSGDIISDRVNKFIGRPVRCVRAF